MPQDVDVGVRETLTSTRDLTPLEAAAHLKIGVGAIRELRDAGYSGHVRHLNADTNYRHSLITQSSIRRFEARFLTLGQLATSMGVAPIHLARWLDREGGRQSPAVADVFVPTKDRKLPGRSAVDDEVERLKSLPWRMAELGVSFNVCNDHLRRVSLRELHYLKANENLRTQVYPLQEQVGRLGPETWASI